MSNTRMLVDTNVLSLYLDAKKSAKLTPVVERLDDYIKKFKNLDFSVITEYEIRRGLLKKDAKKQMKAFDVICSISNIHPVGSQIAYQAAVVWSELRKTGKSPGDHDPLIAATAILHKMAVVTCDRDFEPMKKMGLKIIRPKDCSRH